MDFTWFWSKILISSFLIFGQNGPWNNVCWSSNKKTSLPRQKKISILYRRRTGIVSKGLTHDFVQKLEKISSQCDFGQMSLKIMFDDHPSRKQALLDHTNIDFTQWPYWDFFEGVNPWFWSKIGKFIFACFWTKITLDIIKCLMII